MNRKVLLQAPARVLLLGMIVLIPALVRAADHHVPFDFETISGAIEASQDGDRIVVAPGNYRENIVVSGKSLDIVGEGYLYGYRDPVVFRPTLSGWNWQGLAADHSYFYAGRDADPEGYVLIYTHQGDFVGQFECPPGCYHTNNISYDDTNDALILTCHRKQLLPNGNALLLVHRVDKLTGEVLHTWSEEQEPFPVDPQNPDGWQLPKRLIAAAWYEGHLWRVVGQGKVRWWLEKLDEAGAVLEDRGPWYYSDWGFQGFQGVFIKDGYFWCIGFDYNFIDHFSNWVFRARLDDLTDLRVAQVAGYHQGYWESQGITYVPAGTNGGEPRIFYLLTGSPFAGEERQWTSVLRFLKGEGFQPYSTIDGGEGGRAVVFEDLAGAPSRLAGFRVLGGTGDLGAGIRSHQSSTVIEGNFIRNNLASGAGGGLHLQGGEHTVLNNLFEGNSAGQQGGALFAADASLNLFNNTFVLNTAPQGSGLWLDNVTGAFWNNITAGGHPGAGLHCQGGAVTLANSVFWNNQGGAITGDCLGGIGEEGVIQEDPGFFDEPAGDYRLGVSSPCVDSGLMHEPGLLPDWDVSGTPRVLDGNWDSVAIVDIGAYELIPCDDEDGDGHGKVDVYTCPHRGRDCDDTNPHVHPGAQEICDDGIDNNCSGLIDCDDLECYYNPHCHPPWVDLTLFTATGEPGSVLLRWWTASEIGTAGLNLWRGETEEGEYTRINDTLIPGEGGPWVGSAYEYTDTGVTPGMTYFYHLEAVDVLGESQFFGPVSAAVPPQQGGWVAAEAQAATLKGASAETSAASNAVLMFLAAAVLIVILKNAGRSPSSLPSRNVC